MDARTYVEAAVFLREEPPCGALTSGAGPRP